MKGTTVKDHELRELINTLTATAVEFHGTQQLRERIAGVVLPAISSLRSGWIDANEKLPDDEECVMIVTEDDEVWTGFMDADQWRYASADPVGMAVTHWMSFPPPPSVMKSHSRAVEQYEIMQTGSD